MPSVFNLLLGWKANTSCAGLAFVVSVKCSALVPGGAHLHRVTSCCYEHSTSGSAGVYPQAPTGAELRGFWCSEA